MNLIDYYTALSIGLIGSFHCIGMCGPIAVALPLGKRSFSGRLLGTLLYNGGRSVTYGLLGAAFGFLGKGIQMAGLQQWASILAGSIMIATVIFPAIISQKPSFDRLLQGYAARLLTAFRRLFSTQSYQSLLLIGLLNGLLPCGLVYVAVIGALNTNNTISGIVFMLLFGLGTIPVMAAVSLAGNFISQRFKYTMNKLIPSFIVILGLLFILRGLSLGIPYISPKTQMLTPDKNVKTEGSCCGKH